MFVDLLFRISDVKNLNNRGHVQECNEQVHRILLEYCINCYPNVPVSVEDDWLLFVSYYENIDSIVNEQVLLLTRLNEKYVCTFHGFHISDRTRWWTAQQDKFNRLLSLLPDLRDMAQRGEDFLYFKHMQGNAPHQTLLMEMLVAKKR